MLQHQAQRMAAERQDAAGAGRGKDAFTVPALGGLLMASRGARPPEVAVAALPVLAELGGGGLALARCS